MDVATFQASQTYKGYPLPGEVNYKKLLPAVEHAMILASCNTVRRRSGFLAQTGAESGSYRWMEELADGSAYEWRTDLGNVRAGDGRRYNGRGPIQLTGRHNYTRFSAWAYKNRAAVKATMGLAVKSKTYYVDHPQLLSRDAEGMLATVWYWTKARNMNSYCDRDDIAGMTRAVNGGYNNLSGRTKRYRKCKSLGAALLPTPAKPKPTPAASKPTKPAPAKTRPSTPKPPTKRPSAKYENYRVQPGDTLAGIAVLMSKRSGKRVTWQQLRKLNRIKNANVIRIGQVLRVPARKKAAK